MTKKQSGRVFEVVFQYSPDDDTFTGVAGEIDFLKKYLSSFAKIQKFKITEVK